MEKTLTFVCLLTFTMSYKLLSSTGLLCPHEVGKVLLRHHPAVPGHDSHGDRHGATAVLHQVMATQIHAERLVVSRS